MPRGKNYVNQGKGVSLQAPPTKKGSQMIVCQYGTGCNRPDCIYRHPYGKDGDKGRSSTNNTQSREPCMAYLAGLCTFSALGCRKCHPPPLECERLVAKYSQVKCRFGDSCMTKGCLYMHPCDEGYEDFGRKTNAREPTYLVSQDMAAGAFPPLGASAASAPAAASSSAVAGSWKPSPVGGNVQPAYSSPYCTSTQQQQEQEQQQQQQQYAYQHQPQMAQQYYGQGRSVPQYSMQQGYMYGQGYGQAGQYGGGQGPAPQNIHHLHQHQNSQCEAGFGPLAGSRGTDDDEFPPLSSS
mmetsp:Transcript_2946/g.8579  ORF Transcript_2946/g.8579 Transcript_2946/m.8579 type:complete len:296 (-) Transcript_2946:123-1010(-)